MNVTDIFKGKAAPVVDDWPTVQILGINTQRPVEEVERDLAEARAHGIAVANEFRRAGKPGRALYELARSVERQARMAGLGRHEVEPRSLLADVVWADLS